MKYLDDISSDEIANLNISTRIPLVYEVEEELKPIGAYYLARDGVIFEDKCQKRDI